jgi:hypothetical protein
LTMYRTWTVAVLVPLSAGGLGLKYKNCILVAYN